MNKLFKLLTLFFITILSIFLASCASTRKENNDTTLTQANVVLNLKDGVTTQADVLNAFGAPNIITTNGSGDEVWSYQRNSMTATSDSSGYYATIILAGVQGNGGGFSQSTKTATLIIEFGADKVVKNFKFMSESF